MPASNDPEPFSPNGQPASLILSAGRDKNGAYTLRVTDRIEAPDRGQAQRILFAQQHLIGLLCQDKRVKAVFTKMRHHPEHRRRILQCRRQLKLGQHWEAAIDATITQPNPALGDIISRTVRVLFGADFPWVSMYLIRQ
jgi:hypothetical protein